MSLSHLCSAAPGLRRQFFGLRARPTNPKSPCLTSGPTFVTLRPWNTHTFGFRLPANAPEGQKRFPISLSDVNFYDALVARIPLGRIAEPEDVWYAVLFFVSSGSERKSLRS